MRSVCPSISQQGVVIAIGLNRTEVVFRADQYLGLPETFLSTLGDEAAGIVNASGAGVSEFQIGDRVSTIPTFSRACHQLSQITVAAR